MAAIVTVSLAKPMHTCRCMKHKLIFGVSVVSAVLLVPVVLAQRATPIREPPPKAAPAPVGSSYLLNFDASKLGTLEGVVVRIHQVPNTKVWLTSMNALVRTSTGDVNSGVDMMIATEVRRANDVLHLRREDGTPSCSTT